MNAKQQCPMPGRLQKYLNDELSDTERQVISDHVEDCQTCQGTLDWIVADTTVLEKLNDQAALSEDPAEQSTLPESDPAFSELMRRLSDGPSESAVENQMAVVGKRAPDFDLPCTLVQGSTRGRACLADYLDRWLILLFYPRDFSMVCPTELTALSARFEEFHRRGCDILGICTDSIESHERWIETRLGHLRFPLASDSDGSVARSYGVYLEQQHIALRGLFIIDPNAVLQYQAVHRLSVGRRIDEVVRVLAALESGGMCAEDWCVGSPTVDPTQVLSVGSMISHYRVEATLAQSKFAYVYRAHDTQLDATVALKVFRPNKLRTSEDIWKEARLATKLRNHPNVCTVFDVDDSEGALFIAMEYVDGQPLRAALMEGPMPSDRVATLGRQIAQGMAAAHDQGIVHGDLKPANIMLTSDSVVRIVDFGLSRRLERYKEETNDLVSGDEVKTTSGTLGYMSPEQTRGESITPASDVFSMGLLLYEMLLGRKAIPGKELTQVIPLTHNVDSDRYAAEVPDPFADILRRALVTDSANRRITMEEIALILQ